MTLRTGNPQNKAFTLIELLLVLIILGVIAGMTAPFFGESYNLMALRGASDDAANLMRYAQSQAGLRGLTYQMIFSGDPGTYQLRRASTAKWQKQEIFENIPAASGRAIKLPAGITLTSEKNNMKFFPDGSIEKNRVTFSNGKKSSVVSTYEQRGYVFVFSGEDQ